MKALIAFLVIGISALLCAGCTATSPAIPDDLTVVSSYLPEGLPVFDEDVRSETVRSTETVASAQFDGGAERLADLKEAFESLGFDGVETSTARGTENAVLSAHWNGYEVIVLDNGDGTYTYSATEW